MFNHSFIHSVVGNIRLTNMLQQCHMLKFRPHYNYIAQRRWQLLLVVIVPKCVCAIWFCCCCLRCRSMANKAGRVNLRGKTMCKCTEKFSNKLKSDGSGIYVWRQDWSDVTCLCVDMFAECLFRFSCLFSIFYSFILFSFVCCFFLYTVLPFGGK